MATKMKKLWLVTGRRDHEVPGVLSVWDSGKAARQERDRLRKRITYLDVIEVSRGTLNKPYAD